MGLLADSAVTVIPVDNGDGTMICGDVITEGACGLSAAAARAAGVFGIKGDVVMLTTFDIPWDVMLIMLDIPPEGMPETIEGMLAETVEILAIFGIA